MSAAGKAAGAAPPEAGKVLVVEDTADMRRLVEVVLRTRFEVASASDGLEALELAEVVRPDLVVTDVVMPRLGGDGLVAALRERPHLAHIPVLVLSGKSDAAAKVRLLRAGAQDFLAKPFAPEELLARATNLVQTQRARELLQRELASHSQSLEALAVELTARKREVEAALEVARLAREEAERASAVKTTFLNLVSHELRTPLTTLALSLQSLTTDEGAPLTPYQGKLAGRMERSVGRLGELIDTALAFSASTAPSAQARVSATLVDLCALAREVVQECAPAAARKGLQVALEAGTPVSARTDPRVLRPVLLQLVSNAVRFTDGGEVRVRVLPHPREGAGGPLLEVCDTGPGIPEEARGRIFEPFEHLEPLARKHTPGLGLGLAVVQQLTRALGGRVELTSREGVGSTFRVVLPEASAATDVRGEGQVE